MDSCHKALDNPEVVIDHLGYGSQTVRRAAGVTTNKNAIMQWRRQRGATGAASAQGCCWGLRPRPDLGMGGGGTRPEIKFLIWGVPFSKLFWPKFYTSTGTVYFTGS